MTYCSKCGKELPVGAGFCPSCGAPVAGVPAATPAFAAPPQPMGPLPNYATLVDRGVAVFIDHLILAFVLLIILLPIGLLGSLFAGPGFGLFFGPFVLLGWLLWLLYFSFFEGTTGQTPGKQLLAIKTVDETTQKPVDMGRAFIRNLLRIIDWLPFLYIIGIILVAVEPKRKRLGDMVANTVVVKA